jgi:hypothetical protein
MVIRVQDIPRRSREHKNNTGNFFFFFFFLLGPAAL